MEKHPILYSFRRCPYAIRARMALEISETKVMLYEVNLKRKPSTLLEHSAKGTVPILVLTDGIVLEESLEIMQWALQQNDPMLWGINISHVFINENDNAFKQALDEYKYCTRTQEMAQAQYREFCLPFIRKLETALNTHCFLLGDNACLVDIAIFPFIRQFSMVDKQWFAEAAYPKLQTWLAFFLNTSLFQRVMSKC